MVKEVQQYYKVVLKPITVCVGHYCWDGERICGHFDTEGGHLSCDMGFTLESDETGSVPKPKACMELKDA